MKTTKRKVVFKSYNSAQMFLLPPSLEELIDPNHPVRTVNQVLDKIDATPLFKQFAGGGTSSYHPRMLLKVLVYSYLNNIYSSRKIESALKENIHLMWLSGMSRPDHNTLNRFRSERLKEVLKEVFAQVVLLLVESGHISLQEIYVDGTKIESRANRYSFVWGKAIKTNKEKIQKQLQQLWDYSQQVAKEEMASIENVDFNEIDKDKVEQTIQEIDKALENKEVDKKVRQKLNYARKNWPANLDKYARQQEVLGKRNSYSKTDPDATFMRMKEDHMKNGQLKPAYNVQISTNNQYVVNYTHHQNPTDTLTLNSHIKTFKQIYGVCPRELVADAGYGSEENYSLLEEHNIKAFVKYNYFDKNQRNKDEGLWSNIHYNLQHDRYYCPMGQPMNRIGNRKRRTENGFIQEYARYQAINCEGCPLRGMCNKTNYNKILEVNHNLVRLKHKATELLKSEKGLFHRSKRGVDVEPVFANIKHNKGFKRFMLKGIRKTETETGLLALAHNLAKMAS